MLVLVSVFERSRVWAQLSTVLMDGRSCGVTYFGRERLPSLRAAHIACDKDYLPLRQIASHSS